MKRFILPSLLLGGLITLLAAGLGLDPRHVPSPLIGKPVPTFSLPTLSEPDRLVTQEALLGKPYLLNAWASWCPSCYQEHPLLMQLAAREIPIVGLNVEDERSAALGVLNKTGNPYSVVLVDADGRARIDWGIVATPETFVVDAEGIIRYKHVGPLTLDDWQQSLGPLMYELAEAASDDAAPGQGEQ